MAQTIADRKDVDFVLHEQLQVEELSKHERFAEFTKKTVDMIIKEARNLAIKEILPTMKIGDEEGCQYKNGEVTTPDEFKRVWELMQEGGWLAMCKSSEWGGQGMPETVAMAAKDYFIGANMAMSLFVENNDGAGLLIETFGTEKQKALYLKKMYSGEWGGSMLLTESDAGSDLGPTTTTAVKNEDGTYTLTGNKIFITSGEHDLMENIINPVLARVEGAPEGSRGLSLFIVPKIWVNEDGSLGDRNDIVCTGIEEKLGIHGSPTCTIALGSKGKCRGVLLGKENKGLAQMFLMMNESRRSIASQGLSCTSSSYLYALDYARTRVQGAMLASKDRSPVTIIHHPDVRRMLITMKMYTEGMRSLTYFLGNCQDQIRVADSEEDEEHYENLIDFLIPVAKAYISDRAVEMCNMGIQVFGGYGYTSEYAMNQLLRDVRITPIYEGTNGIQAIDLMRRKLSMKDGELLKGFIGEINKIITRAEKVDRIKDIAARLAQSVERFAVLAAKMRQAAMGPNGLKAFSYASPFLEVTGDITMGWMLLWRALTASEMIEKGCKKKDLAFYEGQIYSAEFLTGTLLPVTDGKMETTSNMNAAIVDIPDASFGGK